MIIILIMVIIFTVLSIVYCKTKAKINSLNNLKI